MNRSNICNSKKTCLRGAHEAPQTKRNRNHQTNEGRPANAVAPLCDDPFDPLPAETEKQKVPTTPPQATSWKSKKGTGAHDRNRRKGLPTQIEISYDNHRKQIKTTIWFRR